MLMGKYMKTICSICVRKGSKGVRNKNLKLLMGRSLLSYTVEHAVQAGIFDYIAVSSDSAEFLKEAKKYGANLLIERPEVLALDTTPKLDVIKHCLIESEKMTGLQFDYVFDLDATSPLRFADDIIQVMQLLTETGAENILTAMPARRSPYFNMVELDDNDIVHLSKDKSIFHRRQDCPKCYDMNASIYAWKRDALLNNSSLFLETTRLYVMPEERSIDIDTPFDFKMVEFLMKDRN